MKAVTWSQLKLSADVSTRIFGLLSFLLLNVTEYTNKLLDGSLFNLQVLTILTLAFLFLYQFIDQINLVLRFVNVLLIKYGLPVICR